MTKPSGRCGRCRQPRSLLLVDAGRVSCYRIVFVDDLNLMSVVVGDLSCCRFDDADLRLVNHVRVASSSSKLKS